MCGQTRALPHAKEFERVEASIKIKHKTTFSLLDTHSHTHTHTHTLTMPVAESLFKQLNEALAGGEGDAIVKGLKVRVGWRDGGETCGPRGPPPPTALQSVLCCMRGRGETRRVRGRGMLVFFFRAAAMGAFFLCARALV